MKASSTTVAAIAIALQFSTLLFSVTFVWTFMRAVAPAKKVVTGLVGLAIMCLVFVFLKAPLSTSSATVTKAFDFAYPILDSVLLNLVTLILGGTAGSTLAKPRLWIFARFASNSFADMMPGWGTLAGRYYSGHPVELLWLHGYLAFAVGFSLRSDALSRFVK